MRLLDKEAAKLVVYIVSEVSLLFKYYFIISLTQLFLAIWVSNGQSFQSLATLT